MSYVKQNFEKGQILKADHLDHMEDGIAQLASEVETPKDGTQIDDTTVGLCPMEQQAHRGYALSAAGGDRQPCCVLPCGGISAGL